MEIQQAKLERQLVGTHKWLTSKDHGAPYNGCGTLWYYTAVGKTYTALIVANKFFTKHPAGTIYVLVPAQHLVKQWKEEIQTHVDVSLWNNIEVFTIHYLVENSIKINCDLLIVDEIHEFLTPDRLVYLEKGNRSNYKWILGLTATWEDSKGRHKQLADICPVVDRISEREALEKGFISKYIEYNLACEFTQTEFNEYKAHSTIISKQLPKFNKSLEIAQRCLTGGTFEGKKWSAYQTAIGWAYHNGWYANGDPKDEEYMKIDDLWNPSKIIGYAKLLMTSIRERKNILYTVADKATKVVELTQRFNTLKTICFAQSTAFADKVGLLINRIEPGACVVYHSKLGTIIRDGRKIGQTVLKREAMEKIKENKARILSTASALDKGLNIEDIMFAITSSGTQNPTQQQQRSGRAKRLDPFAPDAVVLIVNLYVPDTKDEQWLRKRQSKGTSTVYWVDSIDGVSYTPRESGTFKFSEL